MDTARMLREAVKETCELAVRSLLPKIREAVATEILRHFETTGFVAKPRPVERAKPKPKRRMLSDATMRCRHPGCTRRSRGPKYSFTCVKHPIELKSPPNLRVIRGGQAISKGKAPKKAAKAA